MLAFVRFHPAGGNMSDGADRREARRFTMNLPLRVLPRESQGSELQAQTRDVSYRGLSFAVDANFEIGGEIEFAITLPQQVTQAAVVDTRAPGTMLPVYSHPHSRKAICAN